MDAMREKLLARRAKLDARLKVLAERDRRQAARRAERRQSLAGRIVLDRAARDAAFGDQLRALLDSALSDPKDRALFELPETGSATAGLERSATPSTTPEAAT